MTTDWRALCVELLDCLEKADWPHKQKHVFEQWTDIARTALAEPEPEEPTDEEIMELMPQQMRDDLAAAARALAGFDPDNIKAASVFRIILNRHVADHARAVLARWGTPNLAETRRSLTDAWAAHQPAIEAAAKAGMDACRSDGPAVPDGSEPASVTAQPSDHLYVRFASLEWKLGCHMAEWKAARALAYRIGKAGDELNQAHCDGVVRLLREHLEGHGQA